MSAGRTYWFLKTLSQICGWVYTLSWSASFYPQPILNWKRKSTQGTSIDFPFTNVIGFLCYTTSTSVFLFSPTIRSQYADRHPASPEPTTRFNDFAFGVHAVFLTALCYSQYYQCLWGFDNHSSQHVSRPMTGVLTCCAIMVLAILVTVLVKNKVGQQDASHWSWIDLIYAIGNVKLVITFVKYIPQVIMNYQQKSTVGWAIHTILFDLTGGVLSLGQLIIDASLQNDWSGLWGNPVKLGLSSISIFFDVIFIVQHYVLYQRRERTETNDNHKKRTEETPLLRAA